MSAKSANKAAPAKKEKEKDKDKEKKVTAKDKKAAKPAEEETVSTQAETTGQENEEAEEAEEILPGQGEDEDGEHAAALAAANGPTEMSASFKNFRHHPDMENFYRFIYENDLRHEALAIIDDIIAHKQIRKTVKK